MFKDGIITHEESEKLETKFLEPKEMRKLW
jgi:hypothetical protein